MLRELRIQNLAVVEDVALHFGAGLNVLTGSTGAGKSLILGAVNLLLGERAGASVIRKGEERAIVEGVFEVSAPPAHTLITPVTEGSLTLRREVHRAGRSHAFINGKPCTLKQLQELSRALIEPHGQNEQLQLRHAVNHLAYLDAVSDNERARASYRDALATFRRHEAALRTFEERVAHLREKKELLEHRLDELERASIQPGEKDELENTIQVLENAQDIYDALSRAAESVYEGEPSAFEIVSHEHARLRKIATLNDRFREMSEQLENAAITLKETAADMRSYLDGFDFDPDKLESLQARLSFLIALERRYGKSMDEVLRDRDQWREELASIAFEDEERGKLERAVDESVVTLGKAAEVLTASRKKGARSLDRSMTTELGQLMMKGARFRTDVTIEPDEESRLLVDGRSVRPLEDGVDVVEFHVRTNPGETEGSVAEVASSGELSRIALALKRITTLERAAGVLVFDELDAGVGADLGEMIAAKIGALAERYQIICITHMPQIAARGRRHLVVRKETVKGRTYTTVEPVDAEERRAEIARMLGGAEGSEKRLALAAEMLKIQEKSSPNVRP